MTNHERRGGADTLRPTSPYLSRIAARECGVCGDRYRLVHIDEVLFIFLGSAVSKRLLDATWANPRFFQSDRVYLRTRKGIFVTRFRALKQLRARLNPENFVQIHQSLLVGIKEIDELDLDGKVKQVGMALPGGTIESLTVSRRFVHALRSQLGFF